MISTAKALPQAEAQRILECRVQRHKFKNKAETDAFTRKLQENHGWAGVLFVQYVMRNLENVRKLCASIQARVDDKAGLTAENRFWSAQVTYSLAGIVIAKRLGLVMYDTAALFNWAVNDLLEENKTANRELVVPASSVINDYIHENWGSVLWIRSKNNRTDTVIDNVIPENMPRVKFVARYETDVSRLYLLPTPFKKWCNERQLNYKSVVTELKETMGAIRFRMRMAKGTNLNLPATYVLAMNCKLDTKDSDDNASEETDG